MIYIILICLYSYLIIRLLLSLTERGKSISKKIGPKVSIIEIFIIALVISYLFSYYYFEQTEFENFIIPPNLIWIAFTSSIFLLGIGLGVRFILGLLESFIQDPNELHFGRNKEIYEVFSGVWVNMSFLIIFFTYALMEISKPIERISDTVNLIIVYSLSFVLGFLFYLLHNQIHFIVKKATILTMVVISLCLSLFIFETRVDFIKMLPLTTSFIIFNISFFITLLVRIKMRPQELREIEEEFLIDETNPIQPLKSNIRSDIVLNFGNTSILTKPETPSIQLPSQQVFQPSRSSLVYLSHKRETEQNQKEIENSRITNNDIPRSFSLRDLKLSN